MPSSGAIQTTLSGADFLVELRRRAATGNLSNEAFLDALADFWAMPETRPDPVPDDDLSSTSPWRFAVWQAVRAVTTAQRARWRAGATPSGGPRLKAIASGVCLIDHPRGIAVRIERRSACFAVRHADGETLIAPIAWQSLRSAVRAAIVRSWRPETRLEVTHTSAIEPLLAGCVGRSAGLCDPWVDEALRRWWLGERSAFPAQTRALFARLWAAGQRIPAVWLEDDRLRRDRFVVRDILSHRAAAIAAAHIDRLAPDAGSDAALPAMRSWMELFAADRKPSRSLRRTLMNLPPGVAGSVVARLPLIELDAPLLTRWRFLCRIIPRTSWHPELKRPIPRFGHLAQRATGIGPCPPANLTVIDRASESELAELIMTMRAAGRMGRVRSRGPLPLSALRDCLGLLLDYPMPYHGSVLDLLRLASVWHREIEDRFFRDWPIRDGAIPTRDPGIPTVRPPWPDPDDQRVRFLASIGELAEEGTRMRHCVASYVDRAVAGTCFIYHVDHESGPATVELDGLGLVVQARGPRNAVTAAARWSRAWFQEWRSRTRT